MTILRIYSSFPCSYPFPSKLFLIKLNKSNICFQVNLTAFRVCIWASVYIIKGGKKSHFSSIPFPEIWKSGFS